MSESPWERVKRIWLAPLRLLGHLIEVFVANRPLSRPDFEANAVDYDLGGETVKILEVFAPRLGAGSLLRKGKANAFISRRPDQPLPAALVAKLLD